jgi:hypothetical protein
VPPVPKLCGVSAFKIVYWVDYYATRNVSGLRAISANERSKAAHLVSTTPANRKIAA